MNRADSAPDQPRTPHAANASSTSSGVTCSVSTPSRTSSDNPIHACGLIPRRCPASSPQGTGEPPTNQDTSVTKATALGDPDQVTILGDSAGAGSIASLMVMPSATGLFQRAIGQSLPGTFLSDALARDVATAIAAEAGLRPTVEDLSGVDPRELPAIGPAVASKMRQYEDRWGSFARTLSLYSPVVDGEVLPVTPWE